MEISPQNQKQIDEMYQLGLLGNDPNLKLQKLNQARKIAIAVSVTGVTLGITFMFIPPLYFTSMIIKTVCFWVGLAMVFFSKGLYTVKPKSEDPHPSVFYGMFWPSIMLAWNAFRQNPPIKNTLALFFASILIAVILIIILCYSDKLLKNKTSLNLVLFLMLTLPYSYGFISFYNCKLDESIPQTSNITIQKIQNTKFGRKIITFKASDNQEYQYSFSDDQNQLKEKQEYILEERQGIFNLQWYSLKSLNIKENQK